MEYVEKQLVKAVKNHNKSKLYGFIQFLMLKLLGSKICMKFLMEKRWARGFKPSLKYLQKLDADIIVSTHFSTLYYTCEARARGLINARAIAYCPDPVVGRQWDRRADTVALSGDFGLLRAHKQLKFDYNRLFNVPFMIRDGVKNLDKGRAFYRSVLNLPADNFTVLLADGAYGRGKLRKTVLRLLKTAKQRLTVIAVCGKNEKLYKEFCALTAPENICFVPYGFTDKMLLLAACCDIFAGKAGASNLAEPAYFGAPSIVTFCATPIEKWICARYVQDLGCAVKCENVKKAVKLIELWAANPDLTAKYKTACSAARRHDGPEQLADLIYSKLQTQEKDPAAQKEFAAVTAKELKYV
jgi:UDP-N-acetylglucosamine:LPS N-acetylglucosamine transferase